MKNCPSSAPYGQISTLSFAYYHCGYHNEIKPEITCVEFNPAYVEIGKILLPEATWVCADVFDPFLDLGCFENSISNPPFGRRMTSYKNLGKYAGSDFEYLIIDLASRIADFGTFIIPQNSAPFRSSGAQYYQFMESQKHKRFFELTKITMDAGCWMLDAVLIQHIIKGIEKWPLLLLKLRL